MIERGERADDAHHRIGEPTIVVRHVRKVLDLADGVVAEVAHHAALQRRQVWDDGRPIGGDDGIERCQHALVERDVGTEVLPLDLDEAVAQLQRGHRVVPDEAVPRPALGMLDRLEQESVAVAHQLQVGRHRRLQIAQHLGPHRHHGVLRRESVELVPAGSHRCRVVVLRVHRCSPNAR